MFKTRCYRNFAYLCMHKHDFTQAIADFKHSFETDDSFNQASLNGELRVAANFAKEALGAIDAATKTSDPSSIYGAVRRQGPILINASGGCDPGYEFYRWARTDRLNLVYEVKQICVEQGNQPSNDETLLTDLQKCRLPAIDKVQILERFAKIYRQLGNASKEKHLLAEAEKVLPASCRNPWKDWTMLDDASDWYHELIR